MKSILEIDYHSYFSWFYWEIMIHSLKDRNLDDFITVKTYTPIRKIIFDKITILLMNDIANYQPKNLNYEKNS
jgi:hypothetical protein